MKTLSIILVFFFCCLANTISAQAPNWEWVKNAVGQKQRSLAGIGNLAIGRSGNIYITGGFSDSVITFGNITLANFDTSGNTTDIFIAKYDSSGNVLWAKSINGRYNDDASVITLDNHENVYITGYFGSPSITIGNITLTDTLLLGNLEQYFIAKYDSAGNVLWARVQPEVSYIDFGVNWITADSAGNIYECGTFSDDSITFGNTTLRKISRGVIPYNDYDLFFVKYDPQGNVLWGQNMGGDAENAIMNFDSAGNICLSGFCGDSVIGSNGVSLIHQGNPDSSYIFIEKYDTAGNIISARTAAFKDSLGYTINLTVDPMGDTYVAGFFNRDADTVTTSVVICKFDSLGNLLWRDSTGDKIHADGIFTDAAGNVYLIGETIQYATAFGSDTLYDRDTTLYGNADFVVKYDPSGNLVWLQSVDYTEGTQGLQLLSVDASGHVYITGTLIAGVYTFGNNTVADSTTVVFVFLTKLGNCLSAIPPVNTTPPGIDYGTTDTLTVTANGIVRWFSADTGGIYLGSGTTFITPVLDTTTTYYVQDSITGLCNPTSYRIPVTAVVCIRPVPPVNTTSAGALNIYRGNVATLTASGSGTLSWYSSDTGGTYLGTGTSFTTPVLPFVTTYYFYVQDSTCGASTRTAIAITVDSLSGIIAVNGDNNIQVFPNPTTGIIFFKGIESGYKIEVYDVLGQVVNSSIAIGDNYSINLAGNAKGMYFYRVINNADSMQQGKVVLE